MVRFFDFEGTLLAIEPNTIYTDWQIFYNGIGTFEAKVRADGAAAGCVTSHAFVIAEENRRQAIITAYEIGELVQLYGRTLNWIMQKRVVPPFTATKLVSDGHITAKNAEELVRYWVSESFGETDGDFLLADPVGYEAEDDFWRNVANPLSEVVIDCLKNAGLGHRVYFDHGLCRWVFEILQGAELGYIISEAYKNAYDTEYTSDLLDYANGGVYTKSYEDAGEWDAAANSPELTETDSAKAGKKYYVTTGGTRFGITFTEGEYAVYDAEGNIFADNGEQTGYTCTIEPTEAAGIYKWYAVLSAGTEGEAQTELGKLTHKKTLKQPAGVSGTLNFTQS